MKLIHQYFVYIIECSDGLYYTGVTNNLERRLAEHIEGINLHCFTYKRRPVMLKYYERFVNIQNAIMREKQLKGWSRKKKETLFKENSEILQQLSKGRTGDKRQKDSSEASTGSA